MNYLIPEIEKPRIAVFDFTGCEGCELQLANKEDTLAAFLSAVEVVSFREASSAKGTDYNIALIDGCISRSDEIDRIKEIRQQAAVVVAMGSCACFGGVSAQKNSHDLDAANREVYGDKPKETMQVRPISDVVKVDLEIPGCPVSKAEVEQIVRALVMQKPIEFPDYPVCVECRQQHTVCMYKKGLFCMGPITRAGCNAPCPAGGLGCWGCRGPATAPNYAEFHNTIAENGIDTTCVAERVDFYGGFKGKYRYESQS